MSAEKEKCISYEQIHLIFLLNDSSKGIDTVTEIGYGAFAGCRALININFPASLEKIGDEVFTGSPLVQVTVVSGSRAEAFCLENGIPIREADQGQ